MRPFLVAFGCFIAVFGAKSIYVGHFSSDLPSWDQWDTEGEHVFVPYMRGELRLEHLLIPNNEHRVVPTKLLALGLLLANGQWDARLECVANAILQSIIALYIFLLGRQSIPQKWHFPWLLGILAFFAAPMSWQNATAGFHTQQAFLIGFTLATVHLLLDARLFSGRWWGGMACALVSLITMGSGLLGAVAAGATLVFVTPWRVVVRRHGFTITVLIAIACLGWFTRKEVDYHAGLKAQSLHAFALSFWRSLQWPVTLIVVFPILGWAPFAWLGWRLWRRKDESAFAERVIFGVGLWVLLQYLAAAYARGATGDWPAIRYLDTVAIGLAVNLIALLIAIATVPLAGWRSVARQAATLAGLVLLGHGWWVHIDDAIYGAGPWLVRENVQKEANTRAYVRTGDMAHLRAGPIPFPGPDSFVRRIGHPEIRAVLPASVRVAPPIQSASDATSVFSPGAVAPGEDGPGGWPVFGSFTSAGDAATGTWTSTQLEPGSTRYWAIPVRASQANSPDLTLAVVDLSGRELATVLPGPTIAIPHSLWQLAVVRAPEVPSRLVAHDNLSDGWLAFGAPVEMAAVSWWTHRLTRLGPQLFWLGLLMAAAAQFGNQPGWNQIIVRIARREVDRMRMAPRWQLGAGALLIGLPGALAIYLLAYALQPAYFEARVSGDLHKRSMELFYDRGRGIRGEHSIQVWFDEYESVRHLHLRLPPGRIRGLRLDPMDHGATLTMENARIVDVDGMSLRNLPPAAFQPKSQIGTLVVDGSRLHVTSEPGALDSQLYVPLDPPVSTRPVSRQFGYALGAIVAALFGTLAGPALFAGLFGGLATSVRSIRGLLRRPRSAASPIQTGSATSHTSPPRVIRLIGIALVLLAILVLRKSDSFTNPQFWAEDASVFFLDAQNFGIGSLARPSTGYLHLVPRLCAWIASPLEPGLIPGGFVALSVVVLVASTLHLFSPRVRLPWKPLLALAVVCVPHSGEIFLNVTNTQWFTALLLVQLALKDPWTNRTQQTTDLILLILCGLSGPFCLLFLPLFAYRALRHRSRFAVVTLAVVVSCAFVQLAFLSQQTASLGAPSGPVNFQGLAGVVGHRWVYSLLTGMRLPDGDSRWLVGISSGLFLSVLLIAGLWHRRWREPKAYLWFAAFALLAAAFPRVRPDQWLFGDMANGDRYFVLPKIILLWLIVIEASERTKTGWLSRLLLVLIAAVNAGSFRFPAQPDYRWHQHCDALRRGEPAAIPILPEGSIFYYPGKSNK